MQQNRQTRLILAVIAGLVTVFAVNYFLNGRPLTWQEEMLTAQRLNSETLALDIESNLARIDLNPLEADSAELIEASVRHFGDLIYAVDGEQEKRIAIIADQRHVFSGLNLDEMRWRVRLNPSVPLTLGIESEVGDLDLNLRDFTLQALDIQATTGEVNAVLPGGSYEVSLETNVRESSLTLPLGTAVELRAEAEMAELDIEGLERVSGDDDDEQTTWRTPGFDEDQPHIRIDFQGNVGGLRLRFD